MSNANIMSESKTAFVIKKFDIDDAIFIPRIPRKMFDSAKLRNHTVNNYRWASNIRFSRGMIEFKEYLIKLARHKFGNVTKSKNSKCDSKCEFCKIDLICLSSMDHYMVVIPLREEIVISLLDHSLKMKNSELVFGPFMSDTIASVCALNKTKKTCTCNNRIDGIIRCDVCDVFQRCNFGRHDNDHSVELCKLFKYFKNFDNIIIQHSQKILDGIDTGAHINVRRLIDQSVDIHSRSKIKYKYMFVYEILSNVSRLIEIANEIHYDMNGTMNNVNNVNGAMNDIMNGCITGKIKKYRLLDDVMKYEHDPNEIYHRNLVRFNCAVMICLKFRGTKYETMIKNAFKLGIETLNEFIKMIES